RQETRVGIAGRHGNLHSARLRAENTRPTSSRPPSATPVERQRFPLTSTERRLLLGIADAPHAFKSVMRMMATARLSLNAVSFVPLLQVQAKFFLPVKLLPSCSRRSSPSRIWQ